MNINDICLFYHSVKEKCIVGSTSVIKKAYPDHTYKTGKFIMVDIKVNTKFKNFVYLSEIKENNILKNMLLVKRSRLSVMPITLEEYNEIIRLSIK